MKEEIAEIVKFKSLAHSQKITFDEYIENLAHKDKKEIYFIAGKSQSEVLSSPYLAQFKEAKIDVILFTDPIDSFILQSFTEYK